MAVGAGPVAASRLGRAFGALAVAVGALALGATVALAADAPFPDRSPDRPVVDRADVLDRAAIEELTAAVEGLRDTHDVDAVVYLQIKPDIDSFETAVEDARSLMDAWSVGAGAALDGLVILGDLDESRCHGQLVLFADHELQRRLPDDIRQQIFDDELVPLLEECDIRGALSTAMAAIDGHLAGGTEEPEPEPGSDDGIPIFTAEPWPGDPGFPGAPVVSPPSGVDGSTAFAIGILAILAVGAVLTAVRGGGLGGRRSGGRSGWQPFGGHHGLGHRDDGPGWISGSGGSGGGSDSGSRDSGRTGGGSSGGGSSGSGGGAAGGGF